MLANRVPVGGADPRVLQNPIRVWHMWCLVHYRDLDCFPGSDSALWRICKVIRLRCGGGGIKEVEESVEVVDPVVKGVQIFIIVEISRLWGPAG